MKIGQSHIKSRKVRTLIAFLLVVGLLGGASISSFDAEGLNIKTVDLKGVTGAANNLVYVFDRYMIIAPFAPEKAQGEDDGLADLDNNKLYVIDTKKPDSSIQSVDLGCYYPSKLIYDPVTETAFVRGTRYNVVSDGDGQTIYEPVEVITHLRVHLGDDGKPVLGTPVSFDIRGLNEDDVAHDAPTDMALGLNGNVLVFTNGKSVYTYTLQEGYIKELAMVALPDYLNGDRVTYVGVENETNILTIATNRKVATDSGLRDSSELWFYSLNANGTVDLLNLISGDKFPEATFIAPGSNVVVAPFNNDFAFAYFVTSNGSLSQVQVPLNALGKIDGTIKVLETYDSLAQADPGESTPRVISFDPATRLLGMVKRGKMFKIRRPTFGKPGRIRRPTFAHINESPALVVAQLNKKHKLVDRRVFVDEFAPDDGLSNLALGEDSSLLVATFAGNLLRLEAGDDLAQSKFAQLGQIGNRVDYLAYNSARSSVVAINSFDSTDEHLSIIEPGSVNIVKLTSGETSLKAGSFFMSLLSSGSGFSTSMTSIRRPIFVGRPNR